MSSPHSPDKEELFMVEDWPMNLDTTREQLRQAQKRVHRYQAALRLANVEIERRNRGIIALTTFTYQASRVASPAGLLKLSLVQALETINAAMGAIVLINTETKALTLSVHKGLTPHLGKILTGQELDHGAMALMPHLVAGSSALLEYRTTDDETERQLLKAGRLTSLVSLSLQLGPKLIGALLIGLNGEKTFTPAELYFLMALSQETAIGLESLRLRDGLWHTAELFLRDETINLDLKTAPDSELNIDLSANFELPAPPASIPQPAEEDLEQLLAAMMEAEDEVQQQNVDLQTLNSIAAMMNRTLNLKDIMQCAVDQTKTTLGTDAAWLYLLDSEGQLVMKAYDGLSKSYVQAMSRLAIKDEIEGLAVSNKKAYFVGSIRDETLPYKIWVDKESIHGVAVVPITRPSRRIDSGQSGSHVLGILITATIAQGPHVWSPREMRLLSSIANQVALAIDNAQLYEKLRDEEVGLRASNEVLQVINDMLLEKNAFLEGFIRDELAPALSSILALPQALLTDHSGNLASPQKQKIATLQQVLNRMKHLAQEATEVSGVLDAEVDRTFEHKTFSGSTKPIRLEKKRDNEASKKEHNSEASTAHPDDHQANAENPAPKSAKEAKPLSFAEAAAAGLVPDYLLDRENS